MDDAGAAQHAGGAISMMEGWTAASLILITILAVVAIAIILWGIKLRRARKAATHQVAESRAVRGVEAVRPSADHDPRPAAPAIPVPPPAPDLRTASPAITGTPPSVDTPEPADARPMADQPIAAAGAMEASPASLAVDLDGPPERADPDSADPDSANPNGADPDSANPNGADPDRAEGGRIPLTRLKGLGPRLATQLAELGYTDVTQIADLTPAEAEALDARLGAFQGRMARDRWIEQARLMTTDRAAYEAQFGRLG